MNTIVNDNRAVCVVGDGVKAEITNGGPEALYVGTGPDASYDNHDQVLEPGGKAVVTGPTYVSAEPSTPVTVGPAPQLVTTKPKPKAKPKAKAKPKPAPSQNRKP